MAYVLSSLSSKAEVDNVIRNTQDKLVVLRFGVSRESVCLHLDDLLARVERELSKMAVIYIIEAETVPEYMAYFDVTLIPATIFFFNGQHIRVNYGTQDQTKFIGTFRTKGDLVMLCEEVYRGAARGKYIVESPIPPDRITQYSLIYKDI